MSGSTVIVGGGNMGSALIAGWIGRGRDPASIRVVDVADSQSTIEAIVAVLLARERGVADQLANRRCRDMARKRRKGRSAGKPTAFW